MKRSSILALSALAIVTSACEKHPASELPKEHGAGEHHADAKHEEKHDAKPAEHGAEAKPEAAKHEGEAKPGEAPKFFPETK
jgi:hypothetical protein